jgi:Glycosyltransferase family 87
MIPPKLALAFLFFLFTGFAQSRTLGHYRPEFILVFAGLLGGYAFWAASPQEKVESKAWDRWLTVGVVLNTLRMLHKPLLLYPEDPHLFFVLNLLLGGAAVLSAAITISVFARGKFPTALGIALLALFFAARVLVPLISPHPHIDVFTSNTLAADYLILGKDPYSQSYPDIYQGAFDYRPGLVYWPALLLWITPFRFLFGDIRYGFIFAELVAVLGLLALGTRRKISVTTSWLFVLLWLSNPTGLFILEQSWIDPLLVAMVCLVALSVHGHRKVIPGILLGITLAVKQYALLIPLFLVPWLWRKKGDRQTLHLLGVALVTFALLLGFFLAGDAGSFYRSTVGVLAHQAMRPDSFSLYAVVSRLGSFTWLGAAMGILTLVWLVLTAGWFAVKKGGSFFAWSAGLALAYSGVFLFGKQAFANYYYFSSFFVLLSLLAASPPSSRT